MPKPPPTLDYDTYPHVLEAVASYAEHGVLLVLRQTCRRANTYISNLLFSHLELYDDASNALVVLSAYTNQPIGVRGAVVSRMNSLLLRTLRLLPRDEGTLDLRAPDTLPTADTVIALTDVNTLSPYLAANTQHARLSVGRSFDLPPGVRRFVLHVRFNEAFDWRDGYYAPGPLPASVQDVTVILSPAVAWFHTPMGSHIERFVPNPAWLADMASWLVTALWPARAVLQAEPPRRLTIVGLEGIEAEWAGLGTSDATDGIEAGLRAAVEERVQWSLPEEGWYSSREQWEAHRDALVQAVSDIEFVPREAYKAAIGLRQWALEGKEYALAPGHGRGHR
ncbi:uncharacterized protein LOC62_03G003930 [Vanrija pseudolonga]|uniref:Uncharacterized protein n=1 Tax=Vanrija pseudolonga TaxID=143232 RepID=A0AAF1BHK6_9TREE|nr:hypothetical protein LOC62_03G003930 [Vanrija pseudolonga]